MNGRPDPLPGRRRSWRSVELALGVVIVAELSLVVWITYLQGDSAFFGSAPVAYVVYGAHAIVLLALVHRSRDRRRPVLRTMLVLVAIGLGVVSAIRVPVSQASPVIAHAPGPEKEPTPFSQLSPDERAEWGLRVLLHRVSGGKIGDSLVSIPAEWRFPDDVEVAVLGTGARSQVWARVVAHDRVCSDFVNPVEASPGRHAAATDHLDYCHPISAAENRLSFYRPRRGSWVLPARRDSSRATPWTQHRRDPEKSGGGDATFVASTWSAPLAAGARSSAAVVGDYVMVGTHGAGSFEAFSASTGANYWRVRVPSWIHHDPVSDGRTVVVGFGDNGSSFEGKAPAGVAAYDLKSGSLVWTAFESGSVMTSPVIAGDEVTYGTSDGILRTRRLDSGALRGTVTLGIDGHITEPGRGVVMGPPALRNDTLVAMLGASRSCAVELAPLRILWCREFPELSGDNGPTLLGDTVIISYGLLRAKLSGWRWLTSFGHVPFKSQMEWIVKKITGRPIKGFGGPGVRALDLRSGQTLWSHAFLGALPSFGSGLGTMAADEQTMVLTLPSEGRILAFDHRTAKATWTAPSGGARGAELLYRGHIFHATRDGQLQVIRTADGVQQCSTAVPRHFDRGGPVRSGEALFFTSIEGDVASVPVRMLEHCLADSVRLAFPPR